MSSVNDDSGVIQPRNAYELLPQEFLPEQRTYPNYERLGIKIPYRCLVVGTSNSSKTSTVVDLLLNQACFSQWVIIAAMLDEPLWEWVQTLLKESGEKAGKNEDEWLRFGRNLSDLPPIEWFNPETNSIVVCDDQTAEKESDWRDLERLAIKCRKSHISLIVIQHSYTKTPQLLRQSMDYFIIKQITQRADLRRTLSQLGDPDQLEQIYREAMKDKKNFLLISMMPYRASLNYALPQRELHGGELRGGSRLRLTR